MNRDEVLTRLGQNIVFTQGIPINVAVILPTFDEVKRFSRDFYNRLDQLPAWLGVNVDGRTVSKCTWDNSNLLFVSNPDRLKGRSINVMYRSKRALAQANSEELDYFNFLAAIAQQPVMDFDDE
jgi:hypothetical protein